MGDRSKHAFPELISRLKNASDEQWLALAFFASALPDSHLQAAIRERATSVQIAHIKNLSIEAEFQWLTILAYVAPHQLTAQHYARVARTLVQYEAEPGGPYNVSNELAINVKCNAAIAQFFRALGTPLPNVETYLSRATNDELDVFTQIAYEYPAHVAPYTLPRTLPAELRCIANAYRRHAKQMNEKEQCTRRWITDCISCDFSEVNKDLKREIVHQLTRFSHHNAFHEAISLTPDFIAAFRRGATSKRESDCLVRANVYFWIAYTLYDNIIDDDEHATQLLPIANVFHRASLKLYKTEQKSHFVEAYFTMCDVANRWELQNARMVRAVNDRASFAQLPSYRRTILLADRSMVHVLGPMLIASRISDFETVNQLENAFRHYLAARQLSDDLFDWKEDLAAGHMSAVVVRVLRTTNATSLSYSNSIQQLKENGEHIFAVQVAPHVGRRMEYHVRNAQLLFKRSGLDTSALFFERINRLADIAAAAQNTANVQGAFSRALRVPYL